MGRSERDVSQFKLMDEFMCETKKEEVIVVNMECDQCMEQNCEVLRKWKMLFV